MKVVDFINRLNEIGYDENTELQFGYTNGDTGDYFELQPETECDPFCYGWDLTGNDIIGFKLNVDDCKDYLDEKSSKFNCFDYFIADLKRLIERYEED